MVFILLAHLENSIFEICGGSLFLNLPGEVLSWLYWTASQSTMFSFKIERIQFQMSKTQPSSNGQVDLSKASS